MFNKFEAAREEEGGATGLSRPLFFPCFAKLDKRFKFVWNLGEHKFVGLPPPPSPVHSQFVFGVIEIKLTRPEIGADIFFSAEHHYIIGYFIRIHMDYSWVEFPGVSCILPRSETYDI